MLAPRALPLIGGGENAYLASRQSTRKSLETKGHGEGAMQGNEKKHDDLTQITGIGAARQRWLAEVFGVRTYDDLAALSADAIEAQLNAESKPYSRSEIELWPQEAAELATKKAQLSIRTTAESSVSEVGNSPAKESNSKEAMAPRAQGGQWKPVATFIVEFQTRRTKDQVIEQRTKVNYHDTDQQVVWPGVESQRISRWMVEQAGDKLHPETEEIQRPELIVNAQPQVAARLSVTVTRIGVYQPAGTEVPLALGKNGRPNFGAVNASNPFTLEADFELSEEATAIIGEQGILYTAKFYAHNRLTGDKIHLGDAETGVLVRGEATYSAVLSNATLPRGTYRLQSLVTAQSEDAVPGYLELPMFHIV